MKNSVEQENGLGLNQFNADSLDRAIIDAQNLVAYTARAGKEVDESILNTLITAKDKYHSDEWTTAFALQFWEAFRQMNLIIRPATVESVRAICLEPRHTGFRGFIQNQYGRSEASQTITRYTLWTLGVLVIVLLFQIYWVIGNSLSLRLTELLDSEDKLIAAIEQAKLDHKAVEVLFKMDEEQRRGEQVLQFEFPNSSDWERETYELIAIRNSLEAELEILGSQLDRNFVTLKRWAMFWEWLVEDQNGLANESLEARISDLDDQIRDKKNQPADEDTMQGEIDSKKAELEQLRSQRAALDFQLAELDSQIPAAEEINPTTQDAIQQDLRKEISQAMDQNQTKITETTNWLVQNDLETIRNKQEAEFEALEDEKTDLEQQQERWKENEKLRRVRLSTEFILIILQSYLLPVLYGLLGASVYVLRTLMREISNVTFSADRSYLLRMALGTLSGLIIGWFIFLLPGQSIVSSMPPLALAFVVGYNIEIVFTLMDRIIAMVTRPDKGDNGGSEPADADHMLGEDQGDTKLPAEA